jgi:hypothetical protein
VLSVTPAAPQTTGSASKTSAPWSARGTRSALVAPTLNGLARIRSRSYTLRSLMREIVIGGIKAGIAAYSATARTALRMVRVASHLAVIITRIGDPSHGALITRP